MEAVVTLVTIEPRGSWLSGDHPAGSAVLTVDDPVAFDEDGGRLRIGDEELAYTSWDEDTATITLAGETVEAHEDGDPVAYLPAESTAYAHVRFGDEPEPVEAVIPHELRDKLAEGPRGDGNGERVRVAHATDNRLTVTAVIDRIPVIDGHMIDPRTIPERAPVAPESSPAVRVSGTAESLVVEAEPVAADVLLEYHVSTDPDFVPTLGDPATLSGPATRSVVHIVLTLPDGTALSEDGTYYVRAIAHNDAGAADPGLVGSGQLNPDVLAELVAQRLVAGFVLAGQIQVGNITITADGGILIPQPGGRIIHFPADGSAAELGGHLFALSITILDKLTLQGVDNQISAGSSLVLSSGVSAPRQGPALDRFHPSMQLVAGDLTGSQRGLVSDGLGEWVTAVAFFGGRLEKRTASGVMHTWSPGDSSMNYDGGVTRIGSHYYVLGVGIGGGPRDGRWFVRRFSAISPSTAHDLEWEWTPSSARTHRPAIGTDGTNLVIAWRNNSQTVVRQYNPATGAQLAAAFSYNHGESGAHCTAVHWNTGDLANPVSNAPRIAVFHNRIQMQFTTAGARVTGPEWSLASVANCLGVAWDGERFRHLDAQGILWTYSTLYGPESRSVDYSWFDSDPAGAGIHETDRGPARTMVQVARSFLRVHAGTPYDTGQPDDPDSVRIWIDGYRQPDLGAGVTQAVYDIPDTTTTSKAPSFAATGAAPATIKSEDPGWELRGDGSGSLTSLIKSGIRSMSTTAGANTVAVTFDEPFPEGVVPHTMIQPRQAAAGSTILDYGTRDATNAGFVAAISRTSGSGVVSFHYIAIAPGVGG